MPAIPITAAMKTITYLGLGATRRLGSPATRLGGAGGGGSSAGVLYKGAKPTLDTTKITTGAFGTKGVGAGLDGIDGQKADALESL